MGVDPLTLGMIGAGIVGAGFSVAGGIEAKKRSEKQAEAIKQEGAIKSRERAKQIKRIAGTQRASFLSSGITLTGEGTAQDVLGETYTTGKEDLDLIAKNTETTMESVLSKGRAEMLSGLGKGVLGIGSTMLPLMGAGTTGSVMGGATDTWDQGFLDSYFSNI